MKLHRIPLFAVAASLALGYANAQTTVATDPVGFVTLSIKGGNPATTALSIPLLDTASVTGQAVGQITGVGASTITNTNAGWATNQLSAAAAPYLIQITSGNAAGRMFLIATNPNTATSLTINSTDILQGNLTNLGVAVGNSYKIVPCDTLNTIFGPNPGMTNPTAAPPAGLGIRGGTSATNSDNVNLIVNGTVRTFFYRTNSNPTNNGWVATTFGNPASGNMALPPYAGLQYIRRATSNITFTVTGSVPTSLRRVMVKNSGQTLLAQYWPVNSTVAGLNLQSIPGWVANSNPTNADRATIVSTNGTSATYFYDGTNWRQQAFGNPIRGTNPVALGSGIQILKVGSAGGYSTYSNAVPYNLQ